MAHPRSNSFLLRVIAILRVDRRAILLLLLNDFAVHDDSCLDPLVQLNIEQVEVVETNFPFTVVAAMEKHQTAHHSGAVSHPLLWWDARAFKLIPSTASGVKHPNVVETGPHVQIFDESTPTTEQEQVLVIGHHSVRDSRFWNHSLL